MHKSRLSLRKFLEGFNALRLQRFNALVAPNYAALSSSAAMLKACKTRLRQPPRAAHWSRKHRIGLLVVFEAFGFRIPSQLAP